MKISRKNSVAVSKDMYGLFFEDINYNLDGGLHAEMLENRNFEAMFAYGKKDNFGTVYDGGYGWELYEDDGFGSTLIYMNEEPVNSVNPDYMVFTGKGKAPSFRNKAYDGIYAEQGRNYFVSFYAKALEGSRTLTVSIKKYGETVAEAKITLEGDSWKKYECTLTPDKSVKQADFVVTLEGQGKVAFDYFSMMPDNAVCKVFRKDLAEKLKALAPSFLRFPGGCIVEGNTLENRYHWKDTIAPVEERKFNWSRWSVHNNDANRAYTGVYPHYGQTYGVGYYEYFTFCEYLEAKPLPVLSVGLACQYMSTEKVDIESEEMQEYIQDALDLIEFANGGTDTEWGRKRAEMGHPEPFGLEYLGIGNEQWQTETVNFFARYEMFEKAIHQKYPEIKLISSSGPDVWSDSYYKAWEWARKSIKENENLMYAIDEHYYVKPEWMYKNVHFYDNYDRSIKVFAGEYACHIPEKAGQMNQPEANTLGAALAEAAFMTGMERNADVIALASYAPLLARMSYTQWSPNLIWFNGEKSFVTPSYYVQQLFSIYRGVKTLSVETGFTGEEELKEALYASGVEDEQGRIIIKVVNALEEEREISLEGEDIDIADNAEYTMMYLAGDKDAFNTTGDMEQVALQETKGSLADKKIKVPANSFSVIIIE